MKKISARCALVITAVLTAICVIVLIICLPRHTAGEGQVEVRVQSEVPYGRILQGNDLPEKEKNS